MVNSVLVTSIELLTIITGNISVLMMVYGGFRYATSGGDSGNVSNAKNTIIYAAIGLSVLLIVQLTMLLPLFDVEPIDLGLWGNPLVVSAGLWVGIGVLAGALRWIRRLPKWIAVSSGWWMPKTVRVAHVEDMWAALLEEPSIARRTRFALNLLLSSPKAGLRERLMARRRERAVIAEFRRMTWSQHPEDDRGEAAGGPVPAL